MILVRRAWLLDSIFRTSVGTSDFCSSFFNKFLKAPVVLLDELGGLLESQLYIDAHLQGFEIQRLSDEIDGAFLQSANFHLDFLGIGKNNDGNFKIPGLDVVQKGEPIHDRHVKVQQDEVDLWMRIERVQPLFAVSSQQYRVIGKHVLDERKISCRIIDCKNYGHLPPLLGHVPSYHRRPAG
jgi:hypothetical protein